ncbi:MAG: hypothetical protein JNL33_15425 [Betaproteobacteria bacterium]|nr:hypothetical protein [Betaproteobacteria bacterium]
MASQTGARVDKHSMDSGPFIARAVGALAVVTMSLMEAEVRGQERVVGYLEMQTRRESREGGGDVAATLGTLRLDGSTTLWAPWIADVSGGVGLTVRRTRFDDQSQEGTDVTGGARLRVFPRSTFPLELFVDRVDSRVSGQLVGPDYRQTAFGFTQNYIPSAGRRYNLTARHADREDERQDLGGMISRTSNDFVSIGTNQSFERHHLDARADYDRLGRDDPARVDMRTMGLVRHRYAPSQNLAVDSLASLSESRIDEPAGAAGNELQQLNSSLFWRPHTVRPVLVTGTVLTSAQDISTTVGGSELQTTVLTGGATLQYSETLALRSAMNGTQIRSAGEEQHNTLLRAGATYSPRESLVGGLRYRPAASADFGLRDESARGRGEEISALFSHGLTWFRTLPEGSKSASVTQQLNGLWDSLGRQQTGLTHSASAEWSTYGTANFASMRAIVSDTRRHDAIVGDSAFQLANLQGNGRYQASRLSSWQGNVTLQATHNETTSNAPWVSSLSANLTYQRERAFNVPLLRFTSEFRALSDDLATATMDRFVIERRARWVWTNRLDYIVGRTQINLRGAISDVEGRRQTLVYLQLRRYFGQQAQ